ncbi:hypothetical protein AGABI1DRAFT_45818, partial [Agaricus bisporus var. burnettii JB137-S8]
GTGSISILFFSFPYGRNSQPMAILSLVFCILNIILFVSFNAFTIARFTLDPKSFKTLLRHPALCLFYACYPMGATTILNVAVDVVYHYYGVGGRNFLYFIWALWWINIAISAVCYWGGTYIMIAVHDHSIPSMTAAWILPVVTFVVASSSGAVIAQSLQAFSIHSALVTVTVSAFILTAGLLMASMMLTVYVLRLVTHGFPPGLSILSVFLPIGVAGQAGYSVSLIGSNFRDLLPLSSSQSPFFSLRSSGDGIFTFCTALSFILWAWAVMWVVYAVLGLVHTFRRTKFQFQLTAWGLVFPNGVFANLTVHLGDRFDSGFFHVVGAIYSILTLMLWCFVAYNSLLIFPAAFKPEPSSAQPIENLEKDVESAKDDMHRQVHESTTTPTYTSRTVSISNEAS